MKNKIYFAALICPNGRKARMIALLSSFEYFKHFFPTVFYDYRFKIGDIERIRYNGNFIDAGIVLENVDRMFDHHLASNLKKLFGCGQSQTATDASGQYHSYIFSHGTEIICVQK